MTALSRELIVAAKARADAATDRPWGHYMPRGGGSDPVFGAIPGDEVAVVKRPNDWRLIAASRSDVPAMAEALLAVLDLHRGVPMVPGLESSLVCDGCENPGRFVYWPCPTVRAVTGDTERSTT